MKKWKLNQLIFMALCCDLGLISKRLIGPAANLITDALHIPGGIGTGFSLMFLVIAASLIKRRGCAFFMAAVQSVLALGMGMVGSMGLLAPAGYLVPGLVIDLMLWGTEPMRLDPAARLAAVNAFAAVSAALIADLLVFHLPKAVLALYLGTAAFTGIICGGLACQVVRRLSPILQKEGLKEDGRT